MNSGQKSTMETNAKEAATAVWFAQFSEDPTTPTTPVKTTTWRTFSLSIAGAWQLILRAWVSCLARWATWDRLGSGQRISRFRARILTSLRKLASTLIHLKSWLHVQATWDRLVVPPTLRGWELLTKVHAIGSHGLRLSWSIRWVQDFSVGIAFAGVAVFAYHILSSTIRSSDTSTSWMQQRHCYRIMRSASVIQRFPLPHPVDYAVHKAVLNEIAWTETEPLLSSLSNASSFVPSNLSELLQRSEEVARYLAYPYLDSDMANLYLSSDIKDLLDRFQSTATPIKVSVELYNDLEVLYRQQQNIAGEAFKRCQSHLGQSWHQTLIRHQPSALKWFGLDFNKWYGVPLQETLRIWEEARLAVAALDQESQRMKQIGYLIAEGRRILDQLATSLNQGHNQCKDNICRQERVQQWLGQAIFSDTSLKEVWNDISVSITDGEASIPIRITDDLCDWAA